jgi:hypothetical protein
MSLANECIPFYEDDKRVTGEPTSTVTGKRCVEVSGDRTADGNVAIAPCPSGLRPYGVASHDAAVAAKVAVLRRMTVPITADGAISAGDQVMVGAVGKAKTHGAVSANEATLTVGAGNSKVKVTAVEEGEDGNAIRLSIVNAGASQALAVDVDGRDIIVTAATNGSSVITSTAAQVIAAINEDNTASQLVTAANGAGSDGTGVVAAVAATNLAGGVGEGDSGSVIGVALADADDGDDAQIALY